MTTAIDDLTDFLKLEVETPTSGLKNLAENPSGDLGGWAWLTPAAGSVMRGVVHTDGARALEYLTAAGAQTFYTEPMPATPGQYIAASWSALSFDAGVYYRQSIQFLQANGTVIQATPLSVYVNTPGNYAVAAFLVPVNTVSARLVFDIYGSNSGAVAVAGKKFRLRNVTVATAATAAPLGPVIVNLLRNPSFETGLTDIGPGEFASVVSRVTLASAGIASSSLNRGAWCGQSTVGTDGNATLTTVPRPIGGTSGQVTPGLTYRFACSRWSASPATWTIEWRWFDAAATLLRTDVSGVQAASTVRAELAATAPPTAQTARIYVKTLGATQWVDAMICVVSDGSWNGAYFDGDEPDVAGAVDYTWSGTAGSSQSQANMSNLPYIPPVSWTDILGSSTQLGIKRRAFDATLTAIVRDTSLDPYTADLLRPGRRIRVTCLSAESAIRELLFAGKILKPTTAYDFKKAKAGKEATITVTAYGPAAELTALIRPSGVATIAELPYVLEGCRVPWNVNGSGNQVGTAVVVSSNDQATALDQVLLTRDSALGYAWFTKEGVINVWGNRAADYYGNGPALLDESAYSQLVPTFDPETCINSVTIIALRFNAATGETEEVTFGPYQSIPSGRLWGWHPAEYRVHGLTDAAVAVLAGQILAANATPQQRIESMRVPIKNVEDLTRDKALIDLYALGQVKNARMGINLDQRIVSIDHSIDSRGRWYLDLGFNPDDTVAGPIATTPVGDANQSQDGVWKALPLSGVWVNFGGAFVPSRVMRKDGMVHVQLMAKGGAVNTTIGVLPPGYRPSATVIAAGTVQTVTSGAASAGTAHTHNMTSTPARFDIGTDGTIVSLGAASNVYASLTVSFPAEA